MNSTTKDFPTPVSPRMRMVYGAFFDDFMNPPLRDSTSLGNRVRTGASTTYIIEVYLIIGMLSSSLKFGTFSSSAGVYPRRPGEFLIGSLPLEDHIRQ